MGANAAMQIVCMTCTNMTSGDVVTGVDGDIPNDGMVVIVDGDDTLKGKLEAKA